MRLTALDEAAERFGLRIGQGLAEARAICAALDMVEADPAADRAFLEAIADWCDRYTPLVALDGEDGLVLDITGCAHLFGGETCLVDDLAERLTGFGLAVQLSVAPTPGLARAVSRFGGPRVILGPDACAALAPLPVAALRLEPKTIMDLARVGLKTVGDLIPAASALRPCSGWTRSWVGKGSLSHPGECRHCSLPSDGWQNRSSPRTISSISPGALLRA